MSRDFSPRMHWAVNMQYKDLYFSNIKYTYKDKTEWMYTGAELLDRKMHPYMHVLGADIYREIRDILSENDFDALDKELGKLVEADFSGKSTDGFPKEMTDWYYNKHNHYYHEPNDEEFMEYIKKRYVMEAQCNEQH